LIFVSDKPGCRLSPGGAPLCHKVHENGGNRRVRDKTLLECTKTVVIGSGVLRTWTLKCSGSVFWLTLSIVMKFGGTQATTEIDALNFYK